MKKTFSKKTQKKYRNSDSQLVTKTFVLGYQILNVCTNGSLIQVTILHSVLWLSFFPLHILDHSSLLLVLSIFHF